MTRLPGARATFRIPPICFICCEPTGTFRTFESRVRIGGARAALYGAGLATIPIRSLSLGICHDCRSKRALTEWFPWMVFLLLLLLAYSVLWAGRVFLSGFGLNVYGGLETWLAAAVPAGLVAVLFAFDGLKWVPLVLGRRTELSAARVWVLNSGFDLSGSSPHFNNSGYQGAFDRLNE